MRFLYVLMLACLVAGLATAACASDINFGAYARSIAMGGAGLALSDDAAETAVTNPAAGAASGTRLQFIFPSFDLNASGTSINELRSRTDEISSTGANDAIALAKDFGTHLTKMTASFTTGVAGSLSVMANAEAQGIISPGATFRDWVVAGFPTTPADLKAKKFINDPNSATEIANFAAAVGNGTFVGSKLVYEAPRVGFGAGFGTKSGQLWVGGAAKLMRSEVRIWDIAGAVNGSGNVELNANEQPRMTDSGLGVDLGFIYQPKTSKMQYGMVVNNFVEPKLRGIDSSLMWSMGAATRIKKFTYAADLININQAGTEGTRLRTGVEWMPISKLAIRAGYSGTGFTWGLGALGLNIAFTNDAPNMISKSLAF